MSKTYALVMDARGRHITVTEEEDGEERTMVVAWQSETDPDLWDLAVSGVTGQLS